MLHSVLQYLSKCKIIYIYDRYQSISRCFCTVQACMFQWIFKKKDFLKKDTRIKVVVVVLISSIFLSHMNRDAWSMDGREEGSNSFSGSRLRLTGSHNSLQQEEDQHHSSHSSLGSQQFGDSQHSVVVTQPSSRPQTPEEDIFAIPQDAGNDPHFPYNPQWFEDGGAAPTEVINRVYNRRTCGERCRTCCRNCRRCSCLPAECRPGGPLFYPCIVGCTVGIASGVGLGLTIHFVPDFANSIHTAFASSCPPCPVGTEDTVKYIAEHVGLSFASCIGSWFFSLVTTLGLIEGGKWCAQQQLAKEKAEYNRRKRINANEKFWENATHDQIQEHQTWWRNYYKTVEREMKTWKKKGKWNKTRQERWEKNLKEKAEYDDKLRFLLKNWEVTRGTKKNCCEKNIEFFCPCVKTRGEDITYGLEEEEIAMIAVVKTVNKGEEKKEEICLVPLSTTTYDKRKRKPERLEKFGERNPPPVPPRDSSESSLEGERDCLPSTSGTQKVVTSQPRPVGTQKTSTSPQWLGEGAPPPLPPKTSKCTTVSASIHASENQEEEEGMCIFLSGFDDDENDEEGIFGCVGQFSSVISTQPPAVGAIGGRPSDEEDDNNATSTERSRGGKAKDKTKGGPGWKPKPSQKPMPSQSGGSRSSSPDGSGIGLISSYDYASQVSSLIGMQCALFDSSEYSLHTLKLLALKAHESSSESQGSLPSFSSRVVPKYGKTQHLIHVPSSRVSPISSNPIRLPRTFAFMDRYETNLEAKGRSGRFGMIIDCTSKVSVGFAYNRYNEGIKTFNGIPLTHTCKGVVKVNTKTEGVSAVMSFNPEQPGVTGHFAGCHNWGTLKNTRYVSHAGQEISTKGIPTMSMSGGLVQLGYTIVLSKSWSLTPYIEHIVSIAQWKPYKEHIGSFACEISRNKEKYWERNAGIRIHWKATPKMQLQSWIAVVSGHKKTSQLRSSPVDPFPAVYEIGVPAMTNRYKRLELGTFYSGMITDSCMVGMHGSVRHTKNSTFSNKNVNVYLQYSY